jgi:hypothetical protein
MLSTAKYIAATKKGFVHTVQAALEIAERAASANQH